MTGREIETKEKSENDETNGIHLAPLGYHPYVCKYNSYLLRNMRGVTGTAIGTRTKIEIRKKIEKSAPPATSLLSRRDQ
jgi:hypothetical protein